MASGDEGYATPAAAVISLAIALVVTAVMARSLSELHLAKQALAKTQADYALNAAVNEALIAIFTSDQPPPYRWSEASLGEAYQVLAEPERAKMTPQALAALDDAAFAAFGATNPDVVREKLKAIASGPHLTWVADQADAALWRACAASYASPYGAATSLQPLVYNAPHTGAQSPSFRTGEVWRIRAISPDGWRDERFVQFTGDGLNPAAVIDRRLTRTTEGQPQCEDLLSAPASG